MRHTPGKIFQAVFFGLFVAAAVPSARAQKPVRSSIVIPLKKEKAADAKIITVHDTVTMVRVDTLKVVQTVVDTVFRVDTLRDSCSRGAFPLPIPVPIPLDHHVQGPPAVLDPAMPTSVAPEPATFLMVGTGLAAMFGFSWYKRQK